MKVFKLLANLMLLSIVLCIIAILLISTPLGTKTVSKLINNTETGLELKGAKGSILTGLEFEDIHWHDTETEVDVQLKQTTLKLSKLSYIKKGIQVADLSTNQLIITVPITKDDKEVIIPDIPIPLNVHISSLNLNSLLIKNTLGDIYFQANDLQAVNVSIIDQKIKSGALIGQLDVHHQPMDVAVETFQLQLNQPHAMSGHGTVNYKHPLIGDIKGNATIGGTLTDYTLDTDVDWKEFATGKNKVKLKLKGDYQHVSIQSMQIQNKKGDIDLQGDVTWLPALVFDLAIEGKKIKANQFKPELPSELNFKTQLLAKYYYDSMQWDIVSQFTDINGKINQKNITGSGTIKLKDHILSAHKIKLKSQNNYLKIDGRITEPFKLSWDIDTKKINQLFPTLYGDIKGKGTLKGTTQQPYGTGYLQFHNIVTKDLIIIDGMINIDEGRLENNQLIGSLKAKLKGVSYLDHRLGLATIDFKGSFDSKTQQPKGKGTIELANLKGKDIKLKHAVVNIRNIKQLKDRLIGSIQANINGGQYQGHQVGSATMDFTGSFDTKTQLPIGKGKIQVHDLVSKDVSIKDATITIHDGKKIKDNIIGSMQATVAGAKYQGQQVGSATVEFTGSFNTKTQSPTGKGKIKLQDLVTGDIKAKKATITIHDGKQIKDNIIGSVQATLEGVNYQGQQAGSAKVKFIGSFNTKTKIPVGKGKVTVSNLKTKEIKIKHGTIIIHDSKQLKDNIIGSVQATLEGVNYQGQQVGSAKVKFTGSFNTKTKIPVGKGKVTVSNLKTKEIKVKHGTIIIHDSKQLKDNIIGSVQATLEGVNYQGQQVGSAKVKFTGSFNTKTKIPVGKGKVTVSNLKTKEIKVKHGTIIIHDAKQLKDNIIGSVQATLEGVDYQGQQVGSAKVKFTGSFNTKTKIPVGKGKVTVSNLKTKDIKLKQGTFIIHDGKQINDHFIGSIQATVKGGSYQGQQVGSATVQFSGSFNTKTKIPVGKGKVTVSNLKTKEIKIKQGTFVIRDGKQLKDHLIGSVQATLKGVNYQGQKIGSVAVDFIGNFNTKTQIPTGKGSIQISNLSSKDMKIKQGSIIIRDGKKIKDQLAGSVKATLKGLHYQGHDIANASLDFNGSFHTQTQRPNGKGNIQFSGLNSKDLKIQQGSVFLKDSQSTRTGITGAINAQLKGVRYQNYQVGSVKMDYKGALIGKSYLPAGKGRIQFYHLKGKDLKIDQGTLTIIDSKLAANKRLIGNIQAHLQGIRYQDYQLGSADIKFKGQQINQFVAGEGTLDLSTLKHPDSYFKHIRLNFKGNNKKFTLRGTAKRMTLAKQNLNNTTFNIGGSLEHHQLKITSKGNHAIGKIDIVARGGWRNQQWQGQVQKVKLHHDATGQWQLTRATQVNLSSKRISTSEICISNPIRGNLCAIIGWQGKNGFSAKGKLSHVPFVQFKQWLPDNIQLPGHASGHFDIKQQGQAYFGYAKLNLSKDKVIIKSRDNGKTEVAYQKGSIRLDFEGKHIQAEVILDVTKRGQLKSSATITLGKQLNQHRINGTAQFTVKDLYWLQEFFPDITRLRGKITSDIKYQGRLTKPHYQGTIKLTNGQFSIPDVNTHFRYINLLIKTDRPNHGSITGSLQTGEGKLAIKGTMIIKKLNDWNATLSLRGKNLQFINTAQASAKVSPNLQLKINRYNTSITGNLHIPYAKLQFEDLPETSITESDDVVFASEKRKKVKEEVKKGSPLQIIPNVHITLGNNISFKGFGLRSKLKGKLHITENNKVTVTHGNLNIINGQYRSYGQNLVIEHGALIFNGAISNPGLNIRATRSVNEHKVGLNLAGTLQQPISSVFSDPALSESDAVSYLITGQSLGNNSGDQTRVLVQAIRSLGLNQSGTFLNNIGENFGLDDVNIITANDYKKSKVEIGKHLGSRFYIRYITGLFNNFHKVAIDYKINKSWSLQADSGQTGLGTDQGFDLIYEVDRD